MEYLNETLQICFTSKVTYCDKEPSLLPFQFMSYLPLIDLKNGFGLNNIYSDKVHDIHKYNVKIVGSDSKPVA